MLPPLSAGHRSASGSEESPTGQSAQGLADNATSGGGAPDRPDAAQFLSELLAIFGGGPLSAPRGAEQASSAEASASQGTSDPRGEEQGIEQSQSPPNTRAIVEDIERRGMNAVISDIQDRCRGICEPHLMVGSRDIYPGAPRPLLGPVAAALTLDRYQEKYPDLTIIPATQRSPQAATPENLDRMENALNAGKAVFAALDICLAHTQLVGLFPGEVQGQPAVQVFNFDSTGGSVRREDTLTLLRNLPTDRVVIFDDQTFERQVNITGCRAEALVFAKDFHLAQKEGPAAMRDMAQTGRKLSHEGLLPEPTLRVGERRDFLAKQGFREDAPYRFQQGEPVPGKELGRHRNDHLSREGEPLFHHAKTLNYVEHALYRLQQQSRATNTSMAELADAALARHFVPEAREALQALGRPIRRVAAQTNLAAHFAPR